jgi:hypothetical protein
MKEIVIKEYQTIKISNFANPIKELKVTDLYEKVNNFDFCSGNGLFT